MNLNRNCLEEARSMLDQTDRARRMLEQELTDTNETLGEQTCHNQSLVSSVRKGEQELVALNVGFFYYILHLVFFCFV